MWCFFFVFFFFAFLFVHIFMPKTELKELRKFFCLRKSEVSVENISVSNAIGNLVEHCIHCLSCYYSNDIIYLFPWQFYYRIIVKVTSLKHHFAKVVPLLL